jgi:hypothetical protein
MYSSVKKSKRKNGVVPDPLALSLLKMVALHAHRPLL